MVTTAMVSMSTSTSMFSTVAIPGMEMVSALQTMLVSMSMPMTVLMLMLVFVFLVTKSLLVGKPILLHHCFGIRTIVIGVVMVMMVMMIMNVMISMFIFMSVYMVVMHKVVATMLGHEGKDNGEKNEFHAASLTAATITAAFLVAGSRGPNSNSGGAGNEAGLEIFILVCGDGDVCEYFGLRTHFGWMDGWVNRWMDE